MRRKMYVELGGYIGYRKTPLREIQECRLSIIAEQQYEAEEQAEMKRKQQDSERELNRQKMRRGRHSLG